MALNARPTLSTISAFDAEFGTPNKENISAPVFKFSWKDGVALKNRVVIRDYDTNEKVYDCTITTMALKHQLHNQYDTSNKVQVVTYGLKNGHKYIANVYVYTSDGEESLASNDVIFYCFATPTFEFTNFKKFLGENDSIAVLNSSSVNLTVKYFQENDEPLKSYNFELQDFNGTTLSSSEQKYSTLSEDVLRYTIGGIEETETDNYGNIQVDRAYKIICQGQTQHGIDIYTEQKFIVKLITSGVGALITAENIGDGNVAISSNFKVMNAQCSTDNPIYLLDENGEPYALDLSNGDYVEFIDGFIFQSPYELIFRGLFREGKLITFKTVDGDCGYISLNKIEYTTFPFYYFSFSVQKNDTFYEMARSDYFRYRPDLYDDFIAATVDFSYYNGFYSLKTIIDYHDSNMIVLDNNKGDVNVTFLTDYTLTDDGESNWILENSMLSVEDDTNGSVIVTG